MKAGSEGSWSLLLHYITVASGALPLHEMKIQKYGKNTKKQKYDKNTNMQKYKDTKIHKFKKAKI